MTVCYSVSQYGQIGDGTIGGGDVPVSFEVFEVNTFAVVDLPEGADTEDTLYYHTDAIGSVRMVTTRTGQETRYDFLPGGQELLGNAPDRLQFGGKERDQETATAGWQPLDYFGARYYQLQTGRFTSPDPMMTIEENLFDPQRWNRYSYVRNSPLRFVDPDGRNLLKLGFMVAKAAYKGQDIYSSVEGIVESVQTIGSTDSSVGTGERLVATAQLIGELSGASDLLKGGRAILRAVDDGSANARRVFKVGDDAGDVQSTARTLA